MNRLKPLPGFLSQLRLLVNFTCQKTSLIAWCELTERPCPTFRRSASGGFRGGEAVIFVRVFDKQSVVLCRPAPRSDLIIDKRIGRAWSVRTLSGQRCVPDEKGGRCARPAVHAVTRLVLQTDPRDTLARTSRHPLMQHLSIEIVGDSEPPWSVTFCLA